MVNILPVADANPAAYTYNTTNSRTHNNLQKQLTYNMPLSGDFGPRLSGELLHASLAPSSDGPVRQLDERPDLLASPLPRKFPGLEHHIFSPPACRPETVSIVYSTFHCHRSFFQIHQLILRFGLQSHRQTSLSDNCLL